MSNKCKLFRVKFNYLQIYFRLGSRGAAGSFIPNLHHKHTTNCENYHSYGKPIAIITSAQTMKVTTITENHHNILETIATS